MKISKKILVLIMIITILCTSTAFAKYVANITQTSSVKVAKPIIEIVSDSGLIAIDYLNTSDTYSFHIRNYNDNGEVSDVAMNYQVQLEASTFNNMKDLKIRKKKANGSSYTTQTMYYDSSTPMYYTNYYTLPAGTKQDDYFYISMEYPESCQSAYAVFWVQIYAYQVEPTEEG